MNSDHPKTILLVEDEVIISKLESLAIRNFGYEVICAFNGEEAVEIALGTPNLNLVLMDIDLGRGIDGPEAARRILAARQLPIVFLTSHSEREMVEKVRHITRYGYVIKNSGNFVLQSSIEMAFELFDAHEKTRQSEAFLAQSRQVSDENLARLKMTLQASQAGDYELDLTTGAMRCSEALETLYGVPPRHILSRADWDACILPEDRSRVWADVKEAVSKKNGFSSTFRIQRPDTGKTCWMESRGTVQCDADGTPARLIAISIDITARKQTERMLRQWADAFEHCAHGIAIGLPASERILTCNPAFARLQRRTVEEITNMPIASMYAPESRKQLKEWIAQSDRDGSVQYEATMLRKDDSRYPVQMDLVSVRDEAGNLLYRVATQQDLSARKQTEKDLQQSQARFRAIFDQMLEGCQIIGYDWRYIYLNQAAEKHNRRPNTELTGQVFMEIWPGIESTHIFAMLQRCMEERIPCRLENEFTYPDGSTSWFDLSIQPVPEGVFILSIDITERKQSQETLHVALTKYRTLFENFPLGITVTDERGNILETNPMAEHLLGLSQAEQKQRSIDASEWGIIHIDGTPMPESEFASVRALKEKHKIENVEMGIKKPDGNIGWLNVTAAPLPLEGYGVIITYGSMNERKQAEDELKESEERFSVAFNASPVPQAITMQDSGEILVANNAFCQMFEYSLNELIGTTTTKLGMWEDSAARQAAMEEIRATGRMHPREISIRSRSGQLRTLMAAVEPIPWKGFACTILSVFDISLVKKTEETLRQRSEELEQLLDLLPAAIWIAEDPGCQVIRGNRFANELLGVPGNANVSQTANAPSVRLRQFTQGRELNPDELPMQKAGQTGQPQADVELRIENPNGVTRTLLGGAVPLFDPQNRPRGVVGAFYDITERKQVEEALRISQENFARAFESNPAALAITRIADETFVQINPAHSHIFGYQPNEIIGRQGSELNMYVDPNTHQEILRMLQENGQVRDYDLQIRAKSGEIKDVVIFMQTIHFDGEACTLSASLDLTERKNIEYNLRRSNAELEQFAYVASHDLQEPLRAVAGMVQLLGQRYKGQLDKRADEYIHHAVEASTRMQTLINDLLDYSRVDRFGRPFETVDVEQALTLALNNLRVTIEESDAEIIHDPLPIITADPGQLTQVLQNLVGNAIKFRGKRKPVIHLSAKKVGEYWQFAIQDNGIGIEPQYFERIFLVFQRLHTRREYPGTGIGLSLCKKIIERHGGKIWVQSKIEHGSTFYFTIPERKP